MPLLLTLARLPLAPAVVVCLLRGRYFEALGLLALAGLTVVADGQLARRLGATSRLGAYLDPVADKILLVSVYLALGGAALVPVWLVWLVVGRDVLILIFGGLVVRLRRADRPSPSVWGKLSTVVQVVTGVVVIAARAAPGAGLTALAAVLPAITAATTAWSGAHYGWTALRLAYKHRR